MRKNRYVDDLTADDILLLEDGTARKPTLFEGGRNARRSIRIEMNLVFDVSGSVTEEGLLDPMVYNTTLLDGFPNVSLGVYGFARHLLRFCGPTRDPDVLAKAFDRVLNYHGGSKPRPQVIRLDLPPKRKADSRGASWIFEAVIGAAKEAAKGPSDVTRMIIIFSDGYSTTNSRPEDAAALPRELGIPVYPVALGHQKLVEQMKHIQEMGRGRDGELSTGARDRLARVEDREREIMEFSQLGELTGGRSFDPRFVNLMVMRQILGFMAGQVLCEYVAGFTPTPTPGGPKKHKVEVRLRSKDAGKVLGGTRSIVH